MKTTTFILFAIIALNSVAQTTRKSFKINKIEKSIVYFNGTTIVGTVILNQVPNPHLTLNPIEQIVDTSGYTTTFTFNNPKHLTFNDYDLVLSFSGPVITANTLIGIGHFMQVFINDDKTRFEFKAQSMESNTIMKIVVKSKTPVKTAISGLDFAFN